MTLCKKNINSIRKNLMEYDKKRLDIIKRSNTALHYSKRIIFALHRKNVAEAELKMKEVEKSFKEIAVKYKKEPKVFNEGSYKAAVEEYVEAKMFYNFLQGKKMGKIMEVNVEPFIYIAGLADVPGEMLRYAVMSATNKDFEMVKKCVEGGSEIVGEMMEFNLTSYLRTKLDQAKGAVRKLEQVRYEVSLRNE